MNKNSILTHVDISVFFFHAPDFFHFGHVWDNDRRTRHSGIQNRRGRRPRRFRFTDDEFRGHYAT